MAIGNLDELNKFVHDAKQKMSDLDSAAATTGERLGAIETMSKQLMHSIDESRKLQAEANKFVAPSGNDGEVLRSYGADPKHVTTGIADVSKGGKIDARRNRWAGSDAGVVRMIGGVEDGRFEYGLLDDPRPKSEWQHEAQVRAEEIAWVKAIKGAAPAHMYRSLGKHLAKGPGYVGKVFADNAGEGGEFIVNIPMAELERASEIPRQVESLFADMPVSAANGTLPFQSTGIQPFIHNVPSSGDLNPATLPKSVPVTSDSTFAIKTMTLNLPADRDAMEDSIIDFIPYARQLIAEGDRDGTEDAILNGDSAATHGDTAFATWNPRSRWSTLGASNDHRRGWVGLRQRAFDVSSTSDYNSTQTVSAYMGARVLLNVAEAMGDVVYITSPEQYLAKILLDTNVLTVDKYGPSASVLLGEVGKIGGKPLVLSDFMTADLAATGLYTGSGSLTSMVIVNRARFKMLRLRSMRFELATREELHTSFLVASSRKSFHTFDSATRKNCALLFNLSSS